MFGEGARMSRKAHQPDPAQRRQVEAMAAYGIPEDEIARLVDIDPKTLRKHYRDELDLGATKANAQVAGFLFNAARNGNVTAQIFWLKTRARWKETATEHWHSGAIGTFDIAQVADAALQHIISSSAESVQLIEEYETAAPGSTRSGD